MIVDDTQAIEDCSCSNSSSRLSSCPGNGAIDNEKVDEAAAECSSGCGPLGGR